MCTKRSPGVLRSYNIVLCTLSKGTPAVFLGRFGIAPVNKVGRVEAVVVLLEEDITVMSIAIVIVTSEIDIWR